MDCRPFEVSEDDFAPQFGELVNPELYKSKASGRVVAIDMGEVGAMKKGTVAWVGGDGTLHTHGLGVFRTFISFTPDGDHAVAFDRSCRDLVFIDLAADKVHKEPMNASGSVSDLLLLDDRRIVGISKQGLVYWSKLTEGWASKQVKLSKCNRVVWCPELEVVAARTEATKSRLVLFAVAGPELVKLGAFTERVNRVAVDGKDVLAHTVDGDSFVVANLEQVAEKKRAQKSKSKPKSKPKPISAHCRGAQAAN